MTNSQEVRIQYLPCILILGILLSSCGYRQNIMFRTKKTDPLKEQVRQAEGSYTIQKNDLLQLEVYTNQGERIIDPNGKWMQDNPESPAPVTPPVYLVEMNGQVKFPVLPEMKLEGLTIRQAEALLQKEYEKLYEGTFVILKITNKRVVVLGAPGGQVIPLVNENVKLTEILALAKGVSNEAKAKNIRVLRGEQLILADFSTFEGYLKTNITMQPGDIVYVEPVRRPFSEALREYGPMISIITSLATVIIVVNQTNKQD